MNVLGIETSCDETAASVVTAGKRILSNVLHSQQSHLEYGGVVPEVAARAHLKLLQPIVAEALREAKLQPEDIDVVAATGGPGLIGGVIVGVMYAKAFAAALSKPFIAVNHLAGHALTVRMTEDLAFPYLLLLTSGGHCQLVVVRSAMDYEVLGTTIDDAAGEAFDKVGKMLGLAYPAGPKIEALSDKGDATRFDFPKPLIHAAEHRLNFSFSGLKTAVRRTIESIPDRTDQDTYDICASFQQTVQDIFAIKVERALDHCFDNDIVLNGLVIAGGVGANQKIRHELMALCDKKGIPFLAPPAKLCTDNAAMIAWAGAEMVQAGHQSPMDFAPRPRWPLDEKKERNEQ